VGQPGFPTFLQPGEEVSYHFLLNIPHSSKCWIARWRPARQSTIQHRQSKMVSRQAPTCPSHDRGCCLRCLCGSSSLPACMIPRCGAFRQGIVPSHHARRHHGLQPGASI